MILFSSMFNYIIFFHVQIYDDGLECESLIILFSSMFRYMMMV